MQWKTMGAPKTISGKQLLEVKWNITNCCREEMFISDLNIYKANFCIIRERALIKKTKKIQKTVHEWMKKLANEREATCKFSLPSDCIVSPITATPAKKLKQTRPNNWIFLMIFNYFKLFHFFRVFSAVFQFSYNFSY